MGAVVDHTYTPVKYSLAGSVFIKGGRKKTSTFYGHVRKREGGGGQSQSVTYFL